MKQLVKAIIEKDPLTLKEELNIILSAKIKAAIEESMNNLQEAAQKTIFLQSDNGYNWALNIKGIDSSSFKGTFNDQIREKDKINKFREIAKKTHVGVKGKNSMSEVKKFVKDLGPDVQVYARWTAETKYYKDDSVELYYIK